MASFNFIPWTTGNCLLGPWDGTRVMREYAYQIWSIWGSLVDSYWSYFLILVIFNIWVLLVSNFFVALISKVIDEFCAIQLHSGRAIYIYKIEKDRINISGTFLYNPWVNKYGPSHQILSNMGKHCMFRLSLSNSLWI